jgi:alpha-1,6-mannosyltransferase
VRIAQLANFIGPASGGMRTALEALGRGYAEAGAQRLLVIPGPTDTTARTPLGDVVQLRAPRVGGGYRLIVEPWRVIQVLEEFRPTSVELSDKLTLLPVARWARRNAVGSVLFSHERLDDMIALRTGLGMGGKLSGALVNRLLVRSFDQLVVTSAYAQAEFQQLADAVGCPMVRVPLGVDLEVFRPQARPRPVDQATIRLAHAGRMSREKSPQLAVATAAELHRRGLPVAMDVYGDGPHLEEIRAAAGSAPVTFHGFVAGREDLSRRLAAADVSLSVCPGETFGLAVLEALASGTPVVTADRGGARELVDARSGDWGAPTPGALADAVVRLVRRPERERRAAARRRAEEFPWSRTVDRMLAVHDRSATTVGATA